MSIERVEGNQRASAMGLHQAVYGIGMFAGPWIGGRVADLLGIQPMFAVSGIICAILGLLGSRWLSARKSPEV
jgi:MFS family permease